MMKQLPLLLFSLLTGKLSACTHAVSRVIATEGTDAILPCSPSTRVDLEKEWFDWKKVGLRGQTPHNVFSFDETGARYEHYTGQSDQFIGRVSHFQTELKHGNASIIIRKTEVSDSGNYTCVFPRLKPRQELCIHLLVDPILKDRTEENIQGASPKPRVKLLDKANSWAQLHCEVHGAHPEPKVEWWDGSGNILPAEERQVSKTGDSYNVVLQTTVTKTDNYSCVATQEEVNHQTSGYIFVNISGAATEPSVTILKTEDGPLLRCLVRGASPKPLLQWKDSSGNILPAAEPQVSERGGSYDVILQTTVTKTDNYHCVVTQEEIHHHTEAEIYVPLNGERSEERSGSSTGWICAVVVLCIIVVGLVGGVVVYIKRKGKKETPNPAASETDKLN